MRPVKALVAIAVVALALPRSAGAADPKSSLEAFFGTVNPTGSRDAELSIGAEPLPGTIQMDSATGLGVAYRYRLDDRLSLGASVLFATYDVSVSTLPESGKIGDVASTSLLLDANFRVLRRFKRVEVHAGPTLGYAFWGDLQPKDLATDFGFSTARKPKGSLVYGANLGVDLPFEERWLAVARLRYLGTKVDTGDPVLGSVDVNPWILTIGLAYRF